MLALNLVVAALLAGVTAQEAPSPAPEATMGTGAQSAVSSMAGEMSTAVPSATDAAGPTTTDGAAWNTTYVTFPNRGDQGYWVNGAKNKVFWGAVAQPVELRLTNSNTSLFWDSVVIARDVAGGLVEQEVDVQNYPPGNNYVVAVWDASANKKLGQSDGFRIRENGTAPANPGTNPNQPLTGVNTGGNGNNNGSTNPPAGGSDANGTAPNSTDAQPSAPATTSPGSGASRVVISTALVGGLAAVVALV